MAHLRSFDVCVCSVPVYFQGLIVITPHPVCKYNLLNERQRPDNQRVSTKLYSFLEKSQNSEIQVWVISSTVLLRWVTETLQQLRQRNS